MKITLLANRDLASNLALNYLLPRLAGEHTLQVFLSDAVGGAKARPPELDQLKFFEQTLFNDIVFPLVDSGEHRGSLKTFRGLEQHTATPISALNGINKPEGLQTLGTSEPDLVLSIRYGGILRDEAIAVPPLGVINLHSGLLPAYRGVMATFRALLAGDSSLGTTVHYIRDAGIDTGEIIGTTEEAVQPGASYLKQVLDLYPAGCEKLIACVSELSNGGTLTTHAQPSGGQYFSFPDEKELAQFRERGHALFDPVEINSIAQQYFD